MSIDKLLKGNLLVAEPSILNDISFNRSVILLTEHSLEGSVGFIINKPTNYIISDVIPTIKSQHTIYTGGPVSEDNIYFIHCVPHLIPNSIEIGEGIYWAGDFEIVTELLESNTILENDIRFFLGYTGWENKQLKNEIKETSWIIRKNNYSNILNVSTTSFWRNELINEGGEYKIWANAPENPSSN
ncbi:MAG: YqgE/AlgH family protein [Flavobacteriaceae bacterium]